MFYKEGQKEEMACLAASVAIPLVLQKRIALKQLHSAVKDRRLWLKHKQVLTRYVCRRCSFMEADCDFQSESPSDDLEPCGGYAVLACLFENRIIDTADLDTS
jgi:hypothetical protein